MPNTDKMNTMAVISLILGIIGCLSLVGLILGFVSLGQIKRTGERGRGLAIAGIVLFPVWIVIGVVANFAVPDSATTPQAGVSPKATQTKPQTIDVTKMRVGQCINDSATGEIESVKMVPCTTPHDGEVLYTGKLHGLILPTEAQIKQQARTLCDGTASSRLERDPAASVLAMTEYYPTAESWRSGDHGVACVAVHGTEGKKLTRPLKTG